VLTTREHTDTDAHTAYAVEALALAIVAVVQRITK
jgi:hypothetical protein